MPLGELNPPDEPVPLGALNPVEPLEGTSDVLGAVAGDGGEMVPVKVSAPNACEGPNAEASEGAGAGGAIAALGAVVGASAGDATLIALFAAWLGAAATSFPALLLW